MFPTLLSFPSILTLVPSEHGLLLNTMKRTGYFFDTSNESKPNDELLVWMNLSLTSDLLELELKEMHTLNRVAFQSLKEWVCNYLKGEVQAPFNLQTNHIQSYNTFKTNFAHKRKTTHLRGFLPIFFT